MCVHIKIEVIINRLNLRLVNSWVEVISLVLHEASHEGVRLSLRIPTLSQMFDMLKASASSVGCGGGEAHSSTIEV